MANSLSLTAEKTTIVASRISRKKHHLSGTFLYIFVHVKRGKLRGKHTHGVRMDCLTQRVHMHCARDLRG